jgi:hypothetical protein
MLNSTNNRSQINDEQYIVTVRSMNSSSEMNRMFG